LIGFSMIGLMSSDYEKNKADDTNYSLSDSYENSNVKKLINTTWKIKYVDCPICAERVDDIQFLDLGKGFLENKPMRWFLKKDTVHLVVEADACRFEKIFLADDNLMSGSYICKGAPAAKTFTAHKNGISVAVPSSLLSANSPVPTTTATASSEPSKVALKDEISEEKPKNNSSGLTFLDKTYMFKRGLEKKYSERRIDAIILHSSFCANSRNDFDTYCVLGEYKRHGVAAHYLIDRAGDIHRLVSEANVAFHAGFGRMPDGNNHINTRSIGIEMINSQEEGPNEYQYASLANLVRDIKSRYKIKYIKGHNQICPGRKSDPWLFSWKKFYGLVTPDQP
jgi:N-acetylmuramoyl-L-alanine amidase